MRCLLLCCTLGLRSDEEWKLWPDPYSNRHSPQQPKICRYTMFHDTWVTIQYTAIYCDTVIKVLYYNFQTARCDDANVSTAPLCYFQSRFLVNWQDRQITTLPSSGQSFKRYTKWPIACHKSLLLYYIIITINQKSMKHFCESIQMTNYKWHILSFNLKEWFSHMKLDVFMYHFESMVFIFRCWYALVIFVVSKPVKT